MVITPILEELIFTFSKEAQIRRVVSKFEAVISETLYKTDCHMFLEVDETRFDAFIQILTDICHGQIKVILK